MLSNCQSLGYDNESKTLCSYYIEETYLGLELAGTSYQSILQEESHTIDLLFIQIDKYESWSNKFCAATITQAAQNEVEKNMRQKLKQILIIYSKKTFILS